MGPGPLLGYTVDEQPHLYGVFWLNPEDPQRLMSASIFVSLIEGWGRRAVPPLVET